MNAKRSLFFFRLGTLTLGATSLLHLVGHIIGSMRQPMDPEEIQLMQLASSYLFDFGGIQRTLLEIYNGFSLTISILCGFTAVLLYLIGKMGTAVPGLLHKTAGVALMFCLMQFALSIVYLILPPILLFAIASITFLAAWLTLPKDGPVETGVPASV